jgi:chemotaxis protein methyltransferase WspC
MAQRFEALLKRAIGLDTASIGAPAVARAVLERCALSQGDGSTDLNAYWTVVNASADELQMLIEAVIVPETWFFRDREAFVALARLAGERLATQFHRSLRLLSLPCSTGEEPYSMAMALFDAGIPASRFIIDAIDVSDRAIHHAAHAVYGRNSFRGHQIDFRERHFAESNSGWLLDGAVREAVHFQRANLFDAALLDAEPYDFVFCRNVLIYFDRITQDRAVEVLDGLLAPGGTLFVGPAETGLLMRHGMTPTKIPLAFALRRPATTLVAPLVARENTPRHAVAALALPSRAETVGGNSGGRSSTAPVYRGAGTGAHVNGHLKKVTRSPLPSRQPQATESARALAHAAELADQGRLAEAADLTAEHVRAHGPSATAFCLLGLVADASGHAADAGAWYRKALYLEPMHHQALTHLGALLELHGDHVGARLLNERAARASVSNGLRDG